jgi:pimeloyl-ACP methyl ester carboxylesterase
MAAEKATVVLVHGAWADGSCWQNVILPLERLGVNVVCAPIPLTSLSDDIAALSRTLERTSGPVVLAGHAYAGAVIAGPVIVGSGDARIKALVYVAAVAPAQGETVATVFYHEPPHPLAPQLTPDAHGFIWMSQEGFANAVAHNASADQKSVMFAVQRPIHVNCIQEVAPAPTWKTKPTWYLLAEDDRMIQPATQRFMAERMNAKIRPYAVDHTPMYTQPNVVVDVIAEALRDAASR